MYLTDVSPGSENLTINLFLKNFQKFIQGLQDLNFLLKRKNLLIKNSTSGFSQLIYEKNTL